jgi:hypothetical protein
MKLRRYWLTFLAVAMSMLIVQGALAADDDPTVGPAVPDQGAKLEGLLLSIEADTSAAVDDLVAEFATTESEAAQLRASLGSLSPSRLADIAQNATSLDDVNAMLSETILRLGDTSQDFAYTPVTPCRIVDTRVAVGAFLPGQTRTYYVYGPGPGPVGTIQQGGNPAGCPSPNGEPRAVHLNITVVPLVGNGFFKAFPPNVAPPNASIINYRAGVQNIANAATIQTFFSFGPQEIAFQNSGASTAHLIIDVEGYYHETENLAGADFAASSDNVIPLGAPATVKSVSITAPASGKVIVNASGYFGLRSAGTDVGRCSISSAASTAIDFTHLIIVSERTGDAMNYVPFAGTRAFNVSAGTTTFRLNCDEFSGDVSVEDPTINAIWVPRTY